MVGNSPDCASEPDGSINIGRRPFDAGAVGIEGVADGRVRTAVDEARVLVEDYDVVLNATLRDDDDGSV